MRPFKKKLSIQIMNINYHRNSVSYNILVEFEESVMKFKNETTSQKYNEMMDWIKNKKDCVSKEMKKYENSFTS